MSKTSRQGIIDATLLLLRDREFDAITISDICGAAGIVKSTFYYYFASKDEILVNFFLPANDRIYAQMPDIMLKGGPLSQFTRAADLFSDFYERLPIGVLRKMLAIGLEHKDNGFFPTEHPLSRLLTEILRKAQSAGEITRDAPCETLMLMFCQSLIGISYMRCSVDASLSHKAEARKVIEFLFQAEPGAMFAPDDA